MKSDYPPTAFSASNNKDDLFDRRYNIITVLKLFILHIYSSNIFTLEPFKIHQAPGFSDKLLINLSTTIPDKFQLILVSLFGFLDA